MAPFFFKIIRVKFLYLSWHRVPLLKSRWLDSFARNKNSKMKKIRYHCEHRRTTFSIAFSLFLMRLKTTVWRTETSFCFEKKFQRIKYGQTRNNHSDLVWTARRQRVQDQGREWSRLWTRKICGNIEWIVKIQFWPESLVMVKKPMGLNNLRSKMLWYALGSQCIVIVVVKSWGVSLTLIDRSRTAERKSGAQCRGENQVEFHDEKN